MFLSFPGGAAAPPVRNHYTGPPGAEKGRWKNSSLFCNNSQGKISKKIEKPACRRAFCLLFCFLLRQLDAVGIQNLVFDAHADGELGVHDLAHREIAPQAQEHGAVIDIHRRHLLEEPEHSAGGHAAGLVQGVGALDGVKLAAAGQSGGGHGEVLDHLHGDGDLTSGLQPADHDLAIPHEGVEIPEPTVKQHYYTGYGENFLSLVEPPLPEPYDTFANTFSY